jgi:Holliday junction DNA helicase RuvA
VIVGVKGLLDAVGPDWVYLQLGGVTLQVFVPSSAISNLGPIGSQVQLYTDLRIRDEQPVLFGFPSAASLELFALLTGVSGVGPRLALALLSTLGAPGLRQAIASGDMAALASAPGVGGRTAGRIILELKGKVEEQDIDVIPMASDDAQVIAALAALGYSTNEARRAVSTLEKDPVLTLEDRIRLALQKIGSG